MPAPAHTGSGKRSSVGMVYDRADRRAPGYQGRVIHLNNGRVAVAVKSPSSEIKWTQAKNVHSGLDIVNRFISEAVMRCSRQEARESMNLRKYPLPCPKKDCGARAGQPCMSARTRNNLSNPHKDREAAAEKLTPQQLAQIIMMGAQYQARVQQAQQAQQAGRAAV